MSMIGDLFVRLGLNSSGFTNGLGQAQNKTNSFAETIKKAGTWIAGFFAVEKIVEFGKKTVEEFSASEQAATRLLTALKGNVKEQQNLIKLAEERQKLTLFEDDDTINATSLLAAFVKEESQLKRLIPLIQDFATAKQMDLASAANVVGKSIGSETNALGRYGIQINGAAGSTKRFESALKGLSDRFGGQSEALAKVGLGPLEQIKNAWKDIKEEIGGVILKSQAWEDLIANIKVGVDKENFKKNLDDMSDILFVWHTKQLSIWQKLGILIGKNGNADTEKVANGMIQGAKDAEQAANGYKNGAEWVKKLNDEYNKTKGGVVTPKELSDTEIYNLRIKQLTDAIAEAKHALKFSQPTDDIGKLGDAFEDAKKKLIDFKKSYFEAASKKIEDNGNKQQLVIDKKYLENNFADAKYSKEQYEIDTLRLSIETFEKEKKAAIQYGQEVVSIDDKIIKARLELKEKTPEKMSRVSNPVSVKYNDLTGKDVNGKSNKDDLKITTPSLDEIKAQETLDNISKFNNDLNALIQQGMVDATVTFAEGIGNLMSGDTNIGDFGKSLLSMIGKFMVQFGTLMITMGIGMIALKTGISSLNPVLLLAGGAALVAAGTAISNLASGGVSGSGSSSSGSSSSASGYSYSNGSSAMNGNVKFELHGNVLRGVLNNTDRKNSNIS